MFKKALLGVVSLAGVLAITVAVGCGDTAATNGSDDMSTSNTKPDLTSNGMQPDMTVTSDCVMNPMTNVEIINACTTTQPAPDKTPFYPTLAPNGVLPSLP